MSTAIPVPAPEASTEGSWTSWKAFTSDHTRFLTMLPGYLGAYVLLTPFQTECVMMTVNTTRPKKTCPYCSGLHVELFRLCHNPVGDDQGISPTDPVVVYARAFCLAGGRGTEVTKELAKLADAIGPSKASCVNRLCWALLWGQSTGNSINNARDKILSLKLTSVSLLDLVILVWYGPLFIAIGILNAVLKRIPGHFPTLVSILLGVVFWIPQTVFIAPLGLLSLIRHFGVV